MATFVTPNERADEAIDKLTHQEVKVLKLASQQLTNKEIAEQLFISELTAKKHRENICRKLNIRGRVAMRSFLRWISSYFK